MTKRVGIEPYLYINTQFALTILFAVEAMPHKPLSRWDIAIGFDGPGPDHLKAAFLNSRANLFKHLWVGTLHPLVMNRRRVDVAKARRLFHAVQRTAKGCERQIRS